MNIFENYNTAKQKYGNIALEILSQGIPDEYVYLACKFHVEHMIPIDVLKDKFRKWISYVRNLGRQTYNVNTLTYKQFDDIINNSLEKAMKPNPVYDDGTVFMGEFKTKEDALLYPIPNEWCTSNSSNKFNQYTRDGYRLFVIENKSLDEPLKHVCASVFKGRVIYWDVNDIQQLENLANPRETNNSEHEQYQRTLPKPVIHYLYNIAAQQTDAILNQRTSNHSLNTENINNIMKNKKVIRLTESDLHNIIAEAVKNVLREGYGVNRQKDATDTMAKSLMGMDSDDYMKPYYDADDKNYDAARRHGAGGQFGKHATIGGNRAVSAYDPLELRQRMNQLGNGPQDTLRKSREYRTLSLDNR